MAGIPRRAWIAAAVYVALLATLATALYDPYESGDDDFWIVIVMMVGVHVALGIAVARAWVLALPVAAAVVGFFATGGEALSWLIPIFELPIGLTLTAVGWLIGWKAGPRAGIVAAPVFALAALPTAAAAVETVERSRAPHVPAAVQRQLPIDQSLASDCEGDRAVDASGRALLRELEREPDALVTYTYYYADEADSETRDITVSELAEERLKDLRSNPGCRTELKHRIENALAD